MPKIMLTLAAGAAVVTLGSVALWQLSGDGPRRQGALAATIDPVPLSWRGAWTAEARLAPGEVVSYEGSAYVAQEDTSGVEPRCVGKSGCPWALVAARGPQGPTGPQGTQGPAGPPGPAGPLSGVELVTGPYVTLAHDKLTTASVSCPAGKKATGGGVHGDALGYQDLVILASRPQGVTGWYVAVHNAFIGNGEFQMRVYVVCANAD
jgi:hypothetical protein